MNSHTVVPACPWIVTLVFLAAFACINGLDFWMKINALNSVTSCEKYDPNRPLRLQSAALTFENPSGVFDIESDEDWAALLPHGDGFLYPQDVVPNTTLSAISMFHQLHCVDMFRKIYVFAKRGELAAHAKDEVHMLHCLGYLRQGILCAADTTLEKSNTVKRNTTHSNTPLMTTDGMGFAHRCRDASPLRRVLEQSFDNAVKIMKEKFPDELEDIRVTQSIG